MPSSVRIVKLLVPWEDDMDDVAGAIFVHRAANEQVNPWNYDKLQDTSVYTLSFTKVIHMLWNMCLSQCAVLPFNFAWHVQLRNVLLWHANIAPPWVSCFFRGKGAEVHVEVITHGNPGLQIVGWAWKWIWSGRQRQASSSQLQKNWGIHGEVSTGNHGLITRPASHNPTHPFLYSAYDSTTTLHLRSLQLMMLEPGARLQQYKNRLSYFFLQPCQCAGWTLLATGVGSFKWKSWKSSRFPDADPQRFSTMKILQHVIHDPNALVWRPIESSNSSEFSVSVGILITRTQLCEIQHPQAWQDLTGLPSYSCRILSFWFFLLGVIEEILFCTRFPSLLSPRHGLRYSRLRDANPCGVLCIVPWSGERCGQKKVFTHGDGVKLWKLS